jgi:hypothetical protein
VFESSANGTLSVALGDGGGEVVSQVVARGVVRWPGPDTLPPSRFTVLPSALSTSEAADIVAALDGVALDSDPDSVDALPTHEFYLEKV